jgi:subtilisin family serine protease
MAVGAVTSTMEVANFSARGTNDPSTGGSIDIVAPGVEITSSWSTMATHDPNRYLVLSGTSQATPHVSGIAALYAESDQNLRGRDLWNKLITTAQPLPSLDPRDVGAGLVKAPQTGT